MKEDNHEEHEERHQSRQEREDDPISGQRIDLIVGGRIIVELKAVTTFEEIHRAQLISYLRAAGLRGGLLINFRVRVLTQGIRRVVLS